MKRIDFLKQLLLGGTLFLIPKQSQVSAPKEIRLSSPYLAGFQYYKGAELEYSLKANDALRLEREAHNPHDCYAIEVFRDEAKLGYLPRKENKVIARLMDQGIKAKARIIRIDPDEDDYRKVKIMVYYEERRV